VSKAQELKALVQKYGEAVIKSATSSVNSLSRSDPVLKSYIALHAAIDAQQRVLETTQLALDSVISDFDAQQSIIDEQRAEIERLKTPAQVCPVCGSDCNERDELVKAEREIERLTKDGIVCAEIVARLWAGEKSPVEVTSVAIAAGSQTELKGGV
jgi:DNA repair exonuclease SbcCD ATPase subunit